MRISLDRKFVDRLFRRSGESYSDVILRLATRPADVPSDIPSSKPLSPGALDGLGWAGEEGVSIGGDMAAWRGSPGCLCLALVERRDRRVEDQLRERDDRFAHSDFISSTLSSLSCSPLTCIGLVARGFITRV